MSATSTHRVVPGAPPPPQISPSKSSQKKKKKTAATSTAVADDTSAAPSPLTATQNLEVVTNGVSIQGTPPAPSTPAVDSPSLHKLSPIAELVNKRLKATQKKVKRIKEYSSSETELNPDQIRSIASLPGLEAIVKDLEEVKKSIEIHESEISKEESVKRAAVEEAQKAAAAQAIAEAKATGEATAGLLLTFARLPGLIQQSHPLVLSAEVTETESFVIVSATEILTGEESQSKEEIISGFFSSEGELQGVTYSRLIEIAQAVTHSHQHPPAGGVAEGVVHDSTSGPSNTGNVPTGSLLFVHASEIDTPLVEDAPPVEEAVSYEPETVPEQQLAEVTEFAQPSGTIDWSAEEEHDLPPISGLQESFGGEAQPAVTTVDDQAPPEDDGFTTHSGRGRGPRGERRGGRGHRGEGGGRGHGRGGPHGDRGGRGPYRGKGDGEFRGRGEGYRARGDGEWRGRNEGYRGRDGHEGYRGRGRGRGEGRGGPPQPQQG